MSAMAKLFQSSPRVGSDGLFDLVVFHERTS